MKNKLDIGGLSEVAKVMSASRQQVTNWRNRDPSFPKPIVKLRMGPIWDMRTIRKWKAKQ